MKNITDEIRDCLRKTGTRQATLALLSGVPSSTICNLLKGRRKGVHGTTQDALREAIKKIYDNANTQGG